MGKETSTPAQPDYLGAAKETATGNLEAARLGVKANRIDQSTPLGNINYASGLAGDPDRWSSTVSLAPGVQNAFDSNLGFSNDMAGIAGQALPRVAQGMQQGFDTSGMPGVAWNVQGGPLQSSVGALNPEIANQARDAAYSQATARLDPQWQQAGDMQETKLRNQGLVAGGEAYTNAMRDFNFSKNDAYTGARNNAFSQGLAAQQQEYGQQLGAGNFANAARAQEFSQGIAGANFQNQAQAQAMQQAAYLRGLPLQEFNQLRSGAIVGTPTFQAPGSQQTTAGPNISGATAAQGAWDQGVANQQQAGANNFTSGLFSLGAGVLGGAGAAGGLGKLFSW